jgi:predicted ATPase
MPQIEFIGINLLTVENYKSIVQQSIDICPITLLAGANSSGKSSMMQPLLLFKQTLENPQQQSSIFLPGANVNLTTFDQIRSKVSSTPDNLKIGIETGCSQVVSTFRPNENCLDLSEASFNFTCDGWQFNLIRGMPDAAVCQIMRDCYQNLNWGDFPQELSFKLTQERCFFCITPYRPNDSRFQMSPYRPASPIDTDILGIIHLPGLRGDPKNREYARFAVPRYPSNSAPGYLFAGTFPEYTASVIEAWDAEKNGRYEKLNRYAQKLALTNKISTRQINDSFLEIIVGWNPKLDNPDNKDMVSLSEVGTGVSQILPVLVALIAAKKEQIVYIEQPAIHLHPQSLVALASVIAESAQRGVKVVIETHSALLLLALQTIIAKRTKDGELKHDDVALYWFTKDNDGVTQISRGYLDENGTYGDWPQDFSNITMDLQIDYMNAIERRADSMEKD